MAAALQRGATAAPAAVSTSAAAMAISSSSSAAMALSFFITSSPPSPSACSTSSWGDHSSPAASHSPSPLGVSLRSRRLSLRSAVAMQLSGGIEQIERIERISGGGILRHSSFVRGRISSISSSSMEEEDGDRVVASAFGRRGNDGPLYLLGDDYDGEAGGGPIELPPREIEIDPFAIPEASPAQIVASVILTGAIAVLSYRALRKRATRSKEMQFRSSGIKASTKSIQEEARKTVLDNLKNAPEVPTPPPSPTQAAFGAIVAGVIALFLYRFTSSVEAGFSVKAVSQDYSIRNLTITVRTIITGSCYLATFVFAANSIGLTLYAFQLLLGIGVPDSVPPSDSVNKEESNTDDKLGTEDFSED